jgi:hypothetical protein
MEKPERYILIKSIDGQLSFKSDGFSVSEVVSAFEQLKFRLIQNALKETNEEKSCDASS